MNERIEYVLATLDRFRMSDEVSYSAYSALHDEISLLDDLLKEQEPVQVIKRETMHMFFFCCGSCGVAITDGDKFCRMCGRAVKWDD